MEAEEPQHGASTPIPAGAEFPVIQAAPMRSSQTPALQARGEALGPGLTLPSSLPQPPQLRSALPDKA